MRGSLQSGLRTLSTAAPILPGMTVPITTSRVAYTGNGATADFPTTFRFLEDEHLVVKVTPLGGVESVKTLGVDYVVSGAGDDAGGSVGFAVRPAVNDAIVIERVTPVTQETAFRTQGSFSPAVHEEEMDKGRMIDQEIDRRLSDVENSATTNAAIAGNGLSVSGGSTWHVGAGNGIQANADDIAVIYGVAAEMVDQSPAAATAGVLNKTARIDHKHKVPSAAPAAGSVLIGNAAGAGAANTYALSDHVHPVPAAVAPANVNSGPAAAGASTGFAAADHKHDADLGAPVTIGTVNAAGGAVTTLAASDHVHDHGAQNTATHHAVAKADANGFMSATDKGKLDGICNTSYYGTIRTADAVATVVAARDIAEGALELHEVMVSGRKAASGQGGGYMIAGAFRRDGGVVTQIGVTTALVNIEDDAAMGVAFVIVGTQVTVKVTGVAATNIDWSAYARVCRSVVPS